METEIKMNGRKLGMQIKGEMVFLFGMLMATGKLPARLSFLVMLTSKEKMFFVTVMRSWPFILTKIKMAR